MGPSAEAAPAQRLLRALALASLGPLALAFGADAGAYLAWLAIAAPALGAAASGLGVALLPFGLAVPGCWLLVLVAIDASSPSPLPHPFHAALVVIGLFAAGSAVGTIVRGRGASASRAWAASGWLLLAAGLAAGLPGRGGAAGAPFRPELASALLDLSPATLALESAGVDWMRAAPVYDPAGTDRFQRPPYRGALAGPATLLVGCLAAALATLWTGRIWGLRRAREGRP